jgi:hypothetical protein
MTKKRGRGRPPKPENDTDIHISVSKDLKMRLKQVALIRGCAYGDLVREWIREKLDQI